MTPTTSPLGECSTAVTSVDVAVLQRVIDDTIARTSATFAAQVDLTLSSGNDDATVRTAKEGSFHDETLEGVGTVTFEANTPDVAADLGLPDEPFESRLVDGVWWFYNPMAAEPGWIGTDVFEFMDMVGGDPTAGLDGDAWIWLVVDAVETVRDVAVDDQTCSVTWDLLVSGDAIAPLALQGGPLTRLFPEGASTGEAAEATITVDETGMVSAMQIDLGQWAAVATADALDDLSVEVSAMTIGFTMGEFDAPVMVSAPCDNPTPFEEADYPDSVVCPAGGP